MRFTPSFTNLYMADWESKFTWPSGELDGSLVLWKRFVDDIVFVWKRFRMKLEIFPAKMNKKHCNLQFTPNISTQSFNFLDLTIFIENSAAGNSYILNTSCHLYGWVMDIQKRKFTHSRPHSQGRKKKRICKHFVNYRSRYIQKALCASTYKTHV